MPRNRSLIQSHPVLCYYILTFLISWGLVLAAIAALGIPTTTEEGVVIMPIAVIGMLLGPSVAGVLMTALVDGREGFRDLRSRLLTWKVGIGWYAFAILAGPLILSVVPLLLSLFSPAFVPAIFTVASRQSLLLAGLLGGIVVGIFEELGWTGFATPRLRLRHGIWTTGLWMGLLWGAWHIPANGLLSIYIASGTLSPAAFLGLRSLAFMLGWLPASRVLIVWMVDRTGSLLLAMLMHAGLTAASLIMSPGGMYGWDVVISDLALGAAFWVLVAVVAMLNGWTLDSRRSA